MLWSTKLQMRIFKSNPRLTTATSPHSPSIHECRLAIFSVNNARYDFHCCQLRSRRSNLGSFESNGHNDGECFNVVSFASRRSRPSNAAQKLRQLKTQHTNYQASTRCYVQSQYGSFNNRRSSLPPALLSSSAHIMVLYHSAIATEVKGC